MNKRCRDSVLLVISSERWMTFEELKHRVSASDIFLDVALKGLEREGLIESRVLPNVDTNEKHRTHNRAFRRKKQRRSTPS